MSNYIRTWLIFMQPLSGISQTHGNKGLQACVKSDMGNAQERFLLLCWHHSSHKKTPNFPEGTGRRGSGFPPVQAVILVAAAVTVVKVMEAILAPEIRVVAILQRQPLRLGPVGLIPPAQGSHQLQPQNHLPLLPSQTSFSSPVIKNLRVLRSQILVLEKIWFKKAV